jgi:hypothetical protein
MRASYEERKHVKIFSYILWFKPIHIMALYTIYRIRNALSGFLNSRPVYVCGGITYISLKYHSE